MILSTVMSLGRTRFSARCSIAVTSSASVDRGPSRVVLPRMVEINEHDHARLGGDARQRDEPDCFEHGKALARAARLGTQGRDPGCREWLNPGAVESS